VQKPLTTKDSKQAFDHNKDRFPKWREALRRILEEGEIEDIEIERIEVTFLASGEATCRVTEPRSDVTDGCYLPPA
jgi:hypothetical protein